TESRQNAHIFSNTLTGNTFLVYNSGRPAASFFDSEVTADIQSTMFNQSTSSNLVQFTPITFANLGTPSNGTVAYCSDCTIANPCAGSGTGAIAKRLNGAWVCN